MKFKFNCDISGSNNGYDVKDYEKDQIIDEKDLSEFLLDAWQKSNVIEEVKDEEAEGQEEKEENSENEGEETKKDDADEENDADTTSNTGDEDVDNFLNGETDKLPEGTQIISEEEAKKLQENQEEKEENSENGENPDEKLLIDEAKKILAVEDTSIDTDRLKEIGIALHIQNMGKTVNAETIVNKIKKYIEDYEENAENEANADADNVQE